MFYKPTDVRFSIKSGSIPSISSALGLIRPIIIGFEPNSDFFGIYFKLCWIT